MKADPRVKAVVHYIITHAAVEQLGAVKLNKVMWRADVEHYKRYGETITGLDSYIRMDRGPVPRDSNWSIQELKNENKILERLSETFVGTRREFLWLEKASAEHFSATQVEILHEAIREICALSATRASDETHDVLWDEIDNLEAMPVRAASVSDGELEPDDFEWALAHRSLMH